MSSNTPKDEPKEVSRSDMFWNIIQVKMQCDVPRFLRNVLRFNGFTNVVSVKEMDDDDIKDLEDFVQSDKMKTLIPKTANLEDYYGDYVGNPTSFVISRGTKKMLKEIARYCREKWDSDGPPFFDPFNITNKTVFKSMDYSSKIMECSDRNSKARKELLFTKETIITSPFNAGHYQSFENRIPSQVESSGEISKETTIDSVAQSIRLASSFDTAHENVFREFSHQTENFQDLIVVTVPSNNESLKANMNIEDSSVDNSNLSSIVDVNVNNMELDWKQYRDDQHGCLFLRIQEWFNSPNQNALAKYCEVLNMEMIQLYEVDSKSGNILKAKICCPICKKKISSLLRNGDSMIPFWNLSNYERHVQAHFTSPKQPRRILTRLTKSKRNQQVELTDDIKNPPIHTFTPGFSSSVEKASANDDKGNYVEGELESKRRKIMPEENATTRTSTLAEKASDADDEENCVEGNLESKRRNKNSIENPRQYLSGESKEFTMDNLNNILSAPENTLLKEVIESACNNTNKTKNAYRHSEVMKMFASYMKIIGGTLLFETVHANLSTAIPSPSTVNRFMDINGSKIVEGVLRVDELKTFLEERSVPLFVWIAEDATRNIGKICYDPVTNELVGFVPPLNEHGMPVLHLFSARNALEIESHFLNKENVIGTMAYTITAQALSDSVPPFVLTLFSTDNKFTSLNVTNRWEFIQHELGKKGIVVYGYSTDGDTKCLRAMKILTEIGTPSMDVLNCKWFCFGKMSTSSSDGIRGLVYVQDPVHFGTKSRNRPLKTSSILPFGDKIISSAHLKMLIQKVSKDKHFLTNSDIDPKDRQNYRSAEKMCHVRVRQCLQEHIPGSEATVIYLKMMDYATSAYLDPSLSPSDRVKRIWYAVFLARIWRSWLSKTIEKQKTEEKERKKTEKKPNANIVPKTYTLAENFMSSNAYACLEINAHSLIKFIIKLRNSNRLELFLPLLLGSQTCESTFRQLRSMTSTFSTVVNFTLYDMLQRLRRIQLLNDIVTKSSEICPELKFPRYERKMAKAPDVLPSDSELIELIESARQEATCDANNVGINAEDNFFLCQLKRTIESTASFGFDPDDEDYDENEDEYENEDEGASTDFEDIDETEKAELDKDIRVLQSISGSLNMRNYSNANRDERSPYTVVLDGTGKERTVRKSSLCWLLSQDKHFMSSDRLVRVQESDLVKQSKVVFQVPIVNNQSLLRVSQSINIGQWCLFYLGNRFLIGLVVGFSYLGGRTYRSREYSRNFATVVPPVSSVAKTVGVLSTYYNWDFNGTLTEVIQDKFYLDIKHYRATISEPTYEKNQVQINISLVKEINDFIKSCH